MVTRAERDKYRMTRAEVCGNLPHFSDFSDPRLSHAQGTVGGNVIRAGMMSYYQWLHCIGNWGEEHSMCKKQRWYVEKFMHDWWLEKWDEKKALGHFDYVILYGVKPFKSFEPHYKPVKKNRKGAYEFWLDRDFEPLIEIEEACDWRVHAPILHEMFVHGKKPVTSDESNE